VVAVKGGERRRKSAKRNFPQKKKITAQKKKAAIKNLLHMPYDHAKK
jgi:hypothetical protein